MERDFLGLKWKESSETLVEITNNNTFNVQALKPSSWRNNVKNLTFEDKKRAVSGMQCWSQFPAFKATQDDMRDNLTSPLHAYDYNSKPHSTLPKESINTTWKFPFLLETTPTNNQFLGGFPFVESSTTFPTDHPRNKSKQSESLDRLTIIYDNKVYVFENISPDKAEAIICLAKDEYSCLTTEDRKQVDLPLNHNNQPLEPPSIIFNSSVGSSLVTYPATTLALARKATMEHFLEKRKDRLTKGMFYRPTPRR